MEGLWQETAAGPGQLGWDTGACGQGRAEAQDGSTQGMSSAQQTRPECCHCTARGDGCHQAQLPERRASPSATFHGLMRWHLAMACSMAAQDGGMSVVWSLLPEAANTLCLCPVLCGQCQGLSMGKSSA